MSHISKKRLDKDIYDSIYFSLIDLLAGIQTSKEMKIFTSDFFTKTERLMFSKRLAIALFLRKGLEAREISVLLKVSTATVYRVAQLLDHESKGLSTGLDKILKQQKMHAFWEKIDKITREIFKYPRSYIH